MFVLADGGSAFSFGKPNELKTFEYMFRRFATVGYADLWQQVAITYIILHPADVVNIF